MDAVVLSMLVRNEAGRYLSRVLDAALPHVQAASVLDDGSTDETPEIIVRACRAHGVPLVMTCAVGSSWERSGEHVPRRYQWEQACRVAPWGSWVLTLDADEEIVDFARPPERTRVGCLYLYDMWDTEHYRADDLWSAHDRLWPMLMRTDAARSPEFAAGLHCGRYPLSYAPEPSEQVAVVGRIAHWGWSTEADRKAKYARYMRDDPEGKYGSLAQYQSILDQSPNLVRRPW